MHNIELIDYLSIADKEILLEQLSDHHTVIVEELIKLANNKLFKTQSNFTVKQHELYSRGHLRVIEDCYKHSRNAKAIQDVTDKMHHLIRDAMGQLERSIATHNHR
jgi:hypothetical protein